jgi:hypothetical protein
MTKDINIESFLVIQDDLEIQNSSDHSAIDEEEMIIMIERRIAEMMEKDMDLLLSYLYRLDISENKINGCLNPDSPFHPYTCLATLIWERQKQRIRTKQQFKSDEGIDEEWQW